MEAMRRGAPAAAVLLVPQPRQGAGPPRRRRLRASRRSNTDYTGGARSPVQVDAGVLNQTLKRPDMLMHNAPMFQEERNVGFLHRGSVSRSPYHKFVGGQATTRIKAGAWFPYKMDLPALPSGEGTGVDWDFATAFPNPLAPDKCYPWGQAQLEEDAGMLPEGGGSGEPIPALWRVHTADLLLHEIGPDGREVALCPDQEGLDDAIGDEANPPAEGYVRFVLYKEGLRTTQAIYCLARAVGLPLSAFSWAVGMDAKAATTQRVSVALAEGLDAQAVVAALRRWGPHRKAPRGRISVAGISLARHPVAPGETRGRRVVTLLRNVRGTAEAVAAALGELAEQGAPNFVGCERFGMTQGPRPHEVAAEVLAGRWRGAFEKVLAVEAWMNPAVEQILEHVQSVEQVHQGMVDRVPAHLPHVRAMLAGLLEHRSFKKAYTSVAPAMRLMWEGALPALLWNRLAAERLRLYGRRVRAGDVVWVRGEDEPRLVGSEAEAECLSPRDIVMPMTGVSCHDEDSTLWPQLPGCDFGTFVQELAAFGVPYPPPVGEDHLRTAVHYRPLFVTPHRLEWDYYPHEMVNSRVLATDPHAGGLGCMVGDAVPCDAKRLSATHPLRTKGLAGMMYTFDWDCADCGARNVFLRRKCGGCGALQDLSVPPDERRRQRDLNGDLRNCPSVRVSFALPHGSHPSVVLRPAFQLHLWRFYPDGYFYQDVLMPLLQFHLDQANVALPPSRADLQNDSWIMDPREASWHDTKWDRMFDVPEDKIDEWYVRHGWQYSPVDDAQQYTSMANTWKQESEAWWNIILDPAPLDAHVNHAYVHDNNTGGIVRVSKRERDWRSRSVPPERFTFPAVPLPASVRNSKRTTGYYTYR